MIDPPASSNLGHFRVNFYSNNVESEAPIRKPESIVPGVDPGMDGLNTYRAILELHPAQKAIIASGDSKQTV